MRKQLCAAATVAAIAFVSSACQALPARPVSQPAASVIVAYLQARVKGDADTMAQLSCPDWEAQAKIEAASLRTFEARLEGLSCADGGRDGDFTLVQCQGKIVTNYNGESREMDVSHRQFKAVQSGDAWLMCGYK